MDLRTNSDYFSIQHELTGFYYRSRECLLRGTNWVFKSDDIVSPLKVNSVHNHNSKQRRTVSPYESFISIERVSIECCMADVGNFNLLFLKATKNFYLKVSSYENLVGDMKYVGYRMFAIKFGPY